MQGIHSYEVTIETVEGAPPFDYDTFPGNPPPSGLNLDPETGVISGYPVVEGVLKFAVTVQDANGCYGTRCYGVEVVSAPWT